MEKLISSIKCKFSLILDTTFSYVNAGYHFLGATLYGTETQMIEKVYCLNAIEKFHCLYMVFQ